MANKKTRANMPPRNWYQAIGRRGRVALFTGMIFAMVWFTSMHLRIIVRTSKRSDFSVTNGAVFVRSYQWPGISTDPRVEFSKASGAVVWKYKTGRPSSELFPVFPSYRYYYIPFWPVVAIPIGVFLFRFFRRPRLIPGRCYQCGYNLTGNTSGTCPECGTECDPAPDVGEE